MRTYLEENDHPLEPIAPADELIAAQWEPSMETNGAVDCMIEARVRS